MAPPSSAIGSYAICSCRTKKTGTVYSAKGSGVIFTYWISLGGSGPAKRPWPTSYTEALEKRRWRFRGSRSRSDALRFAMAKLHKRWTVLPHGPVESAGDGMLTVEGVIPLPLGNFPRRMTAVGLSKGRSAIFSAIALDEPGMRRIEELGAPSFLIVPNGFHRTDAFSWKKRYPDLRVVCPPGARGRVEKAVPVDSTANILADDQAEFVIVAGTDGAEGALVVRRTGGTTLILNDVLANVRHPPNLGAKIMDRLFGFGLKRPQVPREVKWLFVKDRRALANQFRGWAADAKLRRIIVSHGDVIDADPAATLLEAASTLDS